MRRVVLLCGPPGSGKSTLACSIENVRVYDRDDREWVGSDRRFTAAITRLAGDPLARAVVIRSVVIRSAPTRAARAELAERIGATETVVLAVDAVTCRARVAHRNRPPVQAQMAGIAAWWRHYEPEISEGSQPDHDHHSEAW